MSVVRRLWVVALAVVMLLSGIGWQIATVRSTSFGWTAYAPLSNASYVPLKSLVITPYGANGWPYVLIAAGALLLAGWVGYQLGHRAPKATHPPRTPQPPLP